MAALLNGAIDERFYGLVSINYWNYNFISIYF